MSGERKLFGESKIIIFDTEYTCWEGSQERKWSGPGEQKEVVQIGAILADTTNFSELDHFTIFVRPKINPVLSDFFTKLTGITQSTVDATGVSFKEAMRLFVQWSCDYQFWSYGADARILSENCDLAGVLFPFTSDRFHNLRDLFRSHGIDDTKYMSSTIVRAFGVEPSLRGHDGLNDARTLVQALSLLSNRPSFKA